METQAAKAVKPSGLCQGRGGDRGALKPTEANEQLSGGVAERLCARPGRGSRRGQAKLAQRRPESRKALAAILAQTTIHRSPSSNPAGGAGTWGHPSRGRRHCRRVYCQPQGGLRSERRG